MTSHRFSNPQVILLDIPGTGADALKTALGTPVETRLTSGIADTTLPRLVVVRHPVARLQQIVARFRTPITPDNAPQIPDLTIETALDVLENPRAPFDHSRSYPRARLKAALVPQTHPIRHMHTATHVLRSECLGEDYSAVANLYDLPKLTDGVTASDDDTLPPKLLDRVSDIYAEDFALLGYRPDTAHPVSPPSIPEPPGPQVWTLWPAFFDHEDVRIDAAATALPHAGGPLDPFAQTKTGGRRGETWAGREANLIRHFRKLQPEFADQSRLAHLLGCTIVVMRRDPDCRSAISLFHEITNGYAAHLASEMKLRWLVSVCDSFADHGQTQAQRAMGLAGSLLANTLKLSETERCIYDVPRPWPPRRRWGKGGPLFDGMISYWVEKGEMIDQMAARLEAVCDGDPQAGPFTREILRRAHRHNTVYRRLTELAGQKAPPILDREIRIELEKLTREIL